MFISIKLQNQIRSSIPNALTITVMPSPIDKKLQMFSIRTKNFVAFSIRLFCVHIMYTTVQINMKHSWNHHPLSLPLFHKFYVWWYTCASLSLQSDLSLQNSMKICIYGLYTSKSTWQWEEQEDNTRYRWTPMQGCPESWGSLDSLTNIKMVYKLACKM
jgi:hypothetical protein